MAPQITGGRVVFARTLKVTDFEPKKAEVELSFSVEAGETLDQDFLSRTAYQAQAQVHDMLEIKPPVIKLRPQIDPGSLTLVADGTKTVIRKKATDASRGVKAQGPNIGTGDERINPDEVATAGVAVADQEVNWDAPAATPITDKELVDHISHKNVQIKKPAAINALIAKFAGKTPKTYKDIPQDARQVFLDELQVLA